MHKRHHDHALTNFDVLNPQVLLDPHLYNDRQGKVVVADWPLGKRGRAHRRALHIFSSSLSLIVANALQTCDHMALDFQYYVEPDLRMHRNKEPARNCLKGRITWNSFPGMRNHHGSIEQLLNRKSVENGGNYTIRKIHEINMLVNG